MEIERAISIVTNASYAYKGDRRDHQLIEEALQLISDKLRKEDSCEIQKTTTK